MASIELRTPKNKPAYYKITANITLNGRTIRKFSRFEFDPKTLKTAKQRAAAATAAAFEFEAKAQEEAERSLSGASKPFREVADEYIASTKATVSIPMCDDTVDIVLEDLDFPHEWEELLENSGADTMGDLVDYLCYCSQNNISLAISPEDEEKLYATLIDVCYENMSYDRQVDFWRHVLETNSLVCEVKE